MQFEQLKRSAFKFKLPAVCRVRAFADEAVMKQWCICLGICLILIVSVQFCFFDCACLVTFCSNFAAMHCKNVLCFALKIQVLFHIKFIYIL